MPGDESLTGIAQIAGTFAGCAALTGIVGRRARDSSRHDVAFGRRSGLFGADRKVSCPLMRPASYLTFLYLALIQAVVVFVQLPNSLFTGVDDEST